MVELYMPFITKKKGDRREKFIPTQYVRHSILEDGFAYYLAVESLAIVLSIHQYDHVRLSYYRFPLIGAELLKNLDDIHILAWVALIQTITSLGLLLVTAFMRKNRYNSFVSGVLGLSLSVNWLVHSAILATDKFLYNGHDMIYTAPFIHNLNSSTVIDGLVTSAFCLIFAIIQFNNFYAVNKILKVKSKRTDENG